MLKTTYQQLIEKKIRDDAVLQSIGEGLIVIVDVDKGGKVVYANKVFEDMTGWKLQEVLNKPIVEVLPREDKEGKVVPFKERIVAKVLAKEKVVADLTEPFYYIRKDKSKFPVASVITPIVINKEVIGAVETFRDISKETEADKAKTEFASLVSHQLRTPFSTINWYVELLLSKDVGSLNEKQMDYLQEIYKASKRMVALINVLLSVSRIEMGISSVEEKPTDIVSLAEVILNEVEPEIQEKKLKIEKTFDKNIPQILADSKQLTMIFQNLLANAIKYSLKGGRISLKIGFKGKEIMISVADSGIGIPKTAQSKIFSRFFRAENAKAQEAEGAGLGLYLLKAIIDLMGGKIWFKSQENKGTTFYVTFPIKLGRKKENKIINMKIKNKKILILEDEGPLLGAIKSKFETEGFNVVTAKSVSQALEYLKKGVKIDLIWLDHYLFGKENGLDFITKIRKDGSAWKKLPVFVISNTVSPEKVQSYLKLGVLKCYTKVDFRLDQIIADIKKFLK